MAIREVWKIWMIWKVRVAELQSFEVLSPCFSRLAGVVEDDAIVIARMPSSSTTFGTSQSGLITHVMGYTNAAVFDRFGRVKAPTGA